MPRRIRKRTVKLLLSLTAALVIAGLGYYQQKQPTAPIAQQMPGFYRVVSFSDGDTITVDMDGKHETVRFIGVDTPETHDPRKAVQCYGQAASAFTKQFIGTNNVRLEADPINTNRDRYNRLLRYVYIPDGRMVNAEIIKQGYGFAYTSFPFTKVDDFRKYQQEAQAANKGLWSSCQPAKNQYGGYTSNNAQ